MIPDALGPVALDLPGGAHEWATGVRLLDHDGQLRLVWHGGHEHVCQLTSLPVVDGQRLLLHTHDHGVVVLRAFDPGDTWLVFPAGCSAWEAYSQGLT